MFAIVVWRFVFDGKVLAVAFKVEHVYRNLGVQLFKFGNLFGFHGESQPLDVELVLVLLVLPDKFLVTFGFVESRQYGPNETFLVRIIVDVH